MKLKLAVLSITVFAMGCGFAKGGKTNKDDEIQSNAAASSTTPSSHDTSVITPPVDMPVVKIPAEISLLAASTPSPSPSPTPSPTPRPLSDRMIEPYNSLKEPAEFVSKSGMPITAFAKFFRETPIYPVIPTKAGDLIQIGILESHQRKTFFNDYDPSSNPTMQVSEEDKVFGDIAVYLYRPSDNDKDQDYDYLVVEKSRFANFQDRATPKVVKRYDLQVHVPIHAQIKLAGCEPPHGKPYKCGGYTGDFPKFTKLPDCHDQMVSLNDDFKWEVFTNAEGNPQLSPSLFLTFDEMKIKFGQCFSEPDSFGDRYRGKNLELLNRTTNLTYTIKAIGDARYEFKQITVKNQD